MRFHKKAWAHDFKSNKFTTKALNFGSLLLVKTLGRPRIPCLNQGDTLRCAEFAAVMNGKYIHGEDFSISWQVDKVSRIMGKPVDSGGSDPNAAMDSQTFSKKGGYLLESLWDAKKGPLLDGQAIDYSNEGYVKPNSGKDAFDSICMELQRHYDFSTKKGACVQMFTGFYDTFFLEEWHKIGNLNGYHSYLCIDFDRTSSNEDEHFLVIQNSYGPYIGFNGYHKAFRPVINQLLSSWGMTSKVPAPLTHEQITLAQQQTTLGSIQRQVINIWYALSLYLISLYGKIAR